MAELDEKPSHALSQKDIDEYKRTNSYVPLPAPPHPAHRCSIRPNVVPVYPGRVIVGESAYKFEVVCSCQWKALALNREQANAYRVMHLRRNGELIPEDQEDGN